ncbi:hypothetical protein LMA04_17830 [Pseudescherichia vulneris]|uniref:hypothetical protein n=1 Tax=Pseudescherichia vulneris TaxID=566 RepID=UPI00227CF509|nr:hypothetical protein [Pseudescherichia vulneris]WAH51934.1 hypothetical protein LMA04_17830 [Pseudescherichia vulneris]
MNTLSNERLEEIRDCDTCVTFEESAAMACELLALRKEREAAVPVRYMNRYTGACYTLEQQPDAATDTAVYVPLYDVAQPVAVPTFEEWCQRTEQKPVGWVREAMREAYEGCLAAMLKEAK